MTAVRCIHWRVGPCGDCSELNSLRDLERAARAVLDDSDLPTTDSLAALESRRDALDATRKIMPRATRAAVEKFNDTLRRRAAKGT